MLLLSGVVGQRFDADDGCFDARDHDLVAVAVPTDPDDPTVVQGTFREGW
jgi:hypothetical protein